MSIIAHLNSVLSEAFAVAGYEAQGAFAVRSQRADLADYQCNGAMNAAKAAGKPPRAIADDIAAKLRAHADLFSEISIAGPGFINMRLADTWLGDATGALLDNPKQGFDAPARGRRVVLDFSGPNIAKEMHAGHLRATIIGECLQRLMRFAGDTVFSDAHFGDWGTPMGMIVAELKRERPELPYFDPAIVSGYPAEPPIDIEGLAALYRQASARFKADEAVRKVAREATDELQRGRPGYIALWHHFRTVTFAAVRRNYDRLGVSFDLWLGESDVAGIVPGMIEDLVTRGIAVPSQGAIVIPMESEPSNTPKPPLILEKSDGGYTYGTTDLATIVQRVRDQKPDLIAYVVDVRQTQHFQQVFAATAVAGIAPGVAFRHIANGTINGKDGKPFKTRDGGVMRLEDVLDLAHAKALEELPDAADGDMGVDALDRLAEQISVAAIKFQDLKNNRLTDYVFDVDHFTKFEGKTGPYLQYAIVRCNAILAKAGDRPGIGAVTAGNPSERALMLALLAFPAALEATLDGFEPSILADHAFVVGQAFSTFYAASPVLNEADNALRASRLRLVAIVRQHLTLCLDLLGIEAPEMMPNRKQPKAG